MNEQRISLRNLPLVLLMHVKPWKHMIVQYSQIGLSDAMEKYAWEWIIVELGVVRLCFPGQVFLFQNNSIANRK